MNTYTYYFRGKLVFSYDKDTKTLDIDEDASLCSFIKADTPLMIEYLTNVRRHQEGEALSEEDFKDIEVD